MVAVLATLVMTRSALAFTVPVTVALLLPLLVVPANGVTVTVLT